MLARAIDYRFLEKSARYKSLAVNYRASKPKKESIKLVELEL